MPTENSSARGVVFRVLDAMDAPHGGRILRLRLRNGEAPTVRELRSANLVATAPDGRTVPLEVLGFAVFGGKPTDDRMARTGRADLHVVERGEDGPVGLRWEVRPA